MSTQQVVLTSNDKQRTGVVNTHVLTGRDVLRLPGRASEIQVVYGFAWLSYEGEDLVLSAGESLRFEGHAERAVVTTVKTAGEGMLILEIFEN